MRDKSFGILYVAAGREYVQEAVRSAVSVKKIMPGVGTAIFVDGGGQLPKGLFDIITTLENPTYSFFDKIEPLIETPFEKTLFLDTDTEVIEPVHELSSLLDRFDL